ncbi:MAG: type I-E CRISPR-associated protein Cse1/CasA [Caldisericales bacterium]|nr:type I-E CRISPR-associated protein Cse1/CasA [Caldisericales bacterium]
METKEFNLQDEPWIWCTLNGELKELSLKDVFKMSQNIGEITDVSPMVAISIYRFLLAIMYSAFREERCWPGKHEIWSIDDWKNIHADPDGATKQILAYLETVHERMWLFHPEYPFYQKPDLKLKESKDPEDGKMPIGKMRMYSANSSQGTLFDHTVESDFSSTKPVYPDEAARLLLAFQNFDIGTAGTAEYHEDGQETKYLKDSLLRGEAVNFWQGGSLFQTLLLNLIPVHELDTLSKFGYPAGDSSDRPSFEVNPGYFWKEPGCRQKTDKGDFVYIKKVEGIIDYLTWQSRKTKLFRNEQNMTVSFARTKGLVFPGNENMLDPFVIYNYKEGKKPGEGGWKSKIRLDPEKQVWRSLDVLLARIIPSKHDFLPALTTKFLSEAYSKEISNGDIKLSLFCHYQEANQRIKDWSQQTFPIPATYMKNESFVDGIEIVLNMGKEISWGLKKSSQTIIEELIAGKEKSVQIDLEADFWPLLQIPFARFVNDLGQYDEDAFWDDASQLKIREIFSNWQNTIISLARDVFNRATTKIRFNASGINATIKGQQVLERSIAKLKSKYEIDNGGRQ